MQIELQFHSRQRRGHIHGWLESGYAYVGPDSSMNSNYLKPSTFEVANSADGSYGSIEIKEGRELVNCWVWNGESWQRDSISSMLLLEFGKAIALSNNYHSMTASMIQEPVLEWDLGFSDAINSRLDTPNSIQQSR